MKVYQTDSTGVFIGIVEADESPLQPGVFLIPGGCVTVEPPAFENKIARWVEDKWILESIPKPKKKGKK